MLFLKNFKKNTERRKQDTGHKRLPGKNYHSQTEAAPIEVRGSAVAKRHPSAPTTAVPRAAPQRQTIVILVIIIGLPFEDVAGQIP